MVDLVLMMMLEHELIYWHRFWKCHSILFLIQIFFFVCIEFASINQEIDVAIRLSELATNVYLHLQLMKEAVFADLNEVLSH